MSMTMNFNGGNAGQGLAMVEVVFTAMRRIATMQAGVSRKLVGLADLRAELVTMSQCLHDMAESNMPVLRGINPHDLAGNADYLCGLLAVDEANIDQQLRFNRDYGDFTLDLGTYCRSYRDLYEQ